MRHYDSEGASGSMDITQGREVLPTNIKPTHYDLAIEPNFKDFTFDGTVAIDLDVVEDTTSVSVNSLEIDIKEATLEYGGKTLKSESHDYNKEIQTDQFTFGESLTAGSKGKLTIKFVGQLNDKMAGFYRSSYKDDKGETKYLATSQMEPTDARRAVPCFDQPDLKASWTVSITADKELTCLSNMDVDCENDAGDGKKTVKFNKTPVMSTYLLAFIVGDLRYKETNDFRLPIRVYTTPGNEQYADFSLDVAAKTLKFYEEEFQSPYPLPKMDMVAIPDFSAGAMENWGLVTYRIVDLLYDPKTASVDRKQRIAEVVQHELAHQWFGNLVTMDFWEGLWLNEGFATWMSWYSSNKFFPEWKVWETYVVDNLSSALSLDGLRSSHPIEVPVKKVAEINQIFDSISYAKGSSILRMVSKYLGEDVFMEGIRKYLKKHAYGNTQTTDLWAALSEASGKDVEGAMKTWTKKIGYPVVTVTEDGNKLHFKQNRYLKTADVKPEEDETLWPIFVALKTKEGVDEEITFSEREYTMEIKDTEFFKINADQSNVYRTLYTPERLKKLGEAAKSGLLSVEDRAGMLGDAGALAMSGYQKTSALFDLISGFKEEDNYIVWSEISTRIGAVKNAWLFAPEEEREALKKFHCDMFAPLAHRIGWEFKEGEDEILQQLKSLAFAGAGMNGDPEVVKAAMEMFKKFEAGDHDAINPNIRGPVYGIALQNGENEGEKEWEVVLNAYRNGRNNDEKNVALRWLGRSKNPQNIKKTLQFALSNEVKDQDIYQPISGVRAHRPGSEELWSWFQTNYDLLIKKLPPGLSMLGSVVSMCTSNFASREQAEEVGRFFKDKDTKGFDRALAQSLDTVMAKASWIERDSKDVEEWLKSNGYLSEGYKGPKL
ncbi:peptidase family M1-domain-containing protein [Geopyxis carbonaria]|nr:peptidase family M1-domain-containing protein [Geopyxis carbonaria]